MDWWRTSEVNSCSRNLASSETSSTIDPEGINEYEISYYEVSRAEFYFHASMEVVGKIALVANNAGEIVKAGKLASEYDSSKWQLLHYGVISRLYFFLFPSLSRLESGIEITVCFPRLIRLSCFDLT